MSDKIIEISKEELQDLLSRIDELEKALIKYGKHRGHEKDFSIEKTCNIITAETSIAWGSVIKHMPRCSCGLDEFKRKKG